MFKRVILHSLLYVAGTRTSSFCIGRKTDGLWEELETAGSQSTVNRGLLWILREFCPPRPRLLWPSSSQLQIVWIELLRLTDVIGLTVPGACR